MKNDGFEYLNSRLMFGIIPGLENTQKIADALGNPEKSFTSIHIVGTNGKGSTSFYLAGILEAHGDVVGFFSSPHLINVRERIQVNSKAIAEEDLNRLILEVKKVAQNLHLEPSFFEVLTLVAFLYFRERKISIAVLEAGLGGRLDSTAIAGGSIAIVTSIGLEHTDILGHTESEILFEKMNILNERTEKKTFIFSQMHVLNEALEFAKKMNAQSVIPEIKKEIFVPNLGEHYRENASLAFAAAHIVKGNFFDEKTALKALEKRAWPGRMQCFFRHNKLQFILDGAHNSHAVKRLTETLQKEFPNQKFACLFGVLKDKDLLEMLHLLAPFVSHFYLTKTSYYRFEDLCVLKSFLEENHCKVLAAEELSKEYLNQCSTPLLITGSLYMIGGVIELLRDDFEELALFRGLNNSDNEHH